MRIGLVLVLLLAVSTVPARAQGGAWQPAPSALPASLTPATVLSPRDPVALVLRRDRTKGALAGAVIGAVAGVLVANYRVCNVESGGEGNAEGICKAAGLGLGIAVGAIVGGIIGLPAQPAG
jgi:hypothetical protein